MVEEERVLIGIQNLAAKLPDEQLGVGRVRNAKEPVAYFIAPDLKHLRAFLPLLRLQMDISLKHSFDCVRGQRKLVYVMGRINTGENGIL